MEMTHGTCALRMPRNYVAIKANEMEYLEGGYALNMSPTYLIKTVCLAAGAVYANNKAYDTVGLGPLRLAQEIYAHALLWYAAAPLLQAVTTMLKGQIGNQAQSVVDYIRTHSNPIDLGGDSAVRVAAFIAIWTFF